MQLTCNIIIGKFQFNYVTDVEIESSWKKLTDRAVIALPRNIKWKDERINDVIKKGDEVIIDLGYDFELKRAFSGFVTDVSSEVPVVIECEDRMWLLKQTNVTKSFNATKLKDMIAAIVPPGTNYEVADAQISGLRISKVSVAKVLEQLKNEYGIVSFFRDDVLICGFPYSQPGITELYDFEKNVIENKLVFKKEDDVKIQVRAISIRKDNTKLEMQFGEEDGETHTLHFYELGEAQLKKSAEEEMKRLRYTGYRGTIETFGEPYVRHGDTASLKSAEYPERDGEYFIDTVTTKFGINGFRRMLELGKKAN